MATLDLGDIGFKITADTAGFEKSLDRAKRLAEDTTKKLDEVGRKPITPRVGVDGLDKAKRAITDTGREADKLGSKRITLGADARPVEAVASSLSDAAREAASTESAIHGVVGSLGKLAAGAVSIGAIGAAFGSVVKLGNEFQSQMNTLRAVSGATTAELEAVSQRARELGTDAGLTATSAADAAAAMTELAKGGFSVQESMDAARGTLQLAAAAQVDAAQAATIQSQALQAFSLGAEDAARVADVLAGAANASSAEMAGVAQGMQAAGTVANQFGVSFEDTSTALAMFANAGIQGSDAGTMLKSALLALTDQGKPAQAAISQLGLTVYDAQGKFVGMESIMGQLSDASKRMTDEQYQAATATLFGSDAMRFAGIAATQGADGFTKLKDAVTRQGQAAEVAAAQTAGLPGVMERFQNTVEDLQLAVFDELSDSLVGAGNAAIDALDSLEPFITEVAGFAGDGLKLTVDLLSALGKGFSALPGPVKTFAAALVAVKVAQAALNTEIAKGATATIASTYTRAAASITTFGTSVREAYGYVRAGNPEMGRAGAALQTFAGAGGVASTAMGGLKSAAGGVMSMFGGPWGIALAGAAAVVLDVQKSTQALEQAQQNVAASARDAADAQRQLAAELAGSDAALSAEQMDLAAKMVKASMSDIVEMGGRDFGFFEKMAQETVAVDEVMAKIPGMMNEAGKAAAVTNRHNKELRESYEALSSAAEAVGIPMEELNRVVAEGGTQYEQLITELGNSGDAGARAADQLQAARAELEQQIDAARNLTPEYGQLANAMGELADSAGDSDKAMSALRSMLQAMGLAPKDAEQATRQLTETVRDLTAETEQLAYSEAQVGAGLFGDDGKLDYTNTAASALADTLTGLSDELMNVAVNGGDVHAAYESMGPLLDTLAEKYGLTSEQMATLTREMGLVPDEIATAVTVIGAGEAATAVGTVWGALSQIPPEKHTKVDAEVGAAAAELDAIGIKTRELPDGNFEIWAESEQAKADLDRLTRMMGELGDKDVQVTALLDATQLEFSAQEAKQLLDTLALENPSPQAKLIIDELLANGQIARGDLEFLNQQRPEPVANLEKSLLDAGVQDAHGKLSNLAAQSASPKVDVNDSGFWSKAGAITSQLARWANPVTAVVSVIRGRAGGGIAGYAEGGLPAFAYGGSYGYRLPTTGPGTDRTDGILGVGAGNTPTAWVDAGEWIINRRSSAKYNEVLNALNADNATAAMRALLLGLPGFATGGVKSSSQVKSDLAFMNGTPYFMGGWSPSGTDCSGAVSMAVNSALGDPLFASRMSTVTIGQWLAERGFKRGQGGPGDMRVGWWDQGGGVNGHTAIQLGDGTFIESGGNTGGGLTIGGKAGPLSGRGFTDFMYLPQDDESGDEGEYPGDGGVTISGGTSAAKATAAKSGSSSGGAASGFQSVSMSGGTAAAAARMGLGGGGTIGSAVANSPTAQAMGNAAKSVGLGGAWDAMLNTSLGKMGELLLVTEETVSAFNELGQARDEEKKALEAIVEAENNLEEARRDAGSAGLEQAARVEAAEKRLAEARESGDPEKIKAAEDEVKAAREQATDGVKSVADAEKALQQARLQHAGSIGRVRGAEAQYYASLVQAPFQQLGTIFNALGSVASAMAGVYQKLADRERKKLEQAHEALDVWQRQIEAQKALQDATEKSTAMIREQASEKWRSDLAISDAEWELTMHRKRTSKELAEAHLFAADTTEIQARATRRSAVLEAQIGFEKAKRDLQAYERQLSMSAAAADLEHSQKMANIQMSKLSLISGALAEIQKSLNVEGMKELEIKAMKAQGQGAVMSGLGGVVGGIASIIGAIGMFAVNPIGAIAAGLSGFAGVAQGVGGIMGGRAQIEAAKEQQRQLEAAKQRIANGEAPSFMAGFAGKTLEELELREKELLIEYQQGNLQRQRESAEQLEMLKQLVDNAEKELEYAKRDESRADDLASLWEDTNTAQATAFFQLGGAGWDGGTAARKFAPVTDGGFAGVSNGLLAAGSSLQIEGREPAAELGGGGRLSDPQVMGAAAAVVSATETTAIRVQMGQLLQVAARIADAVEGADRVPTEVINGAVFNGPVNVQGGNGGSEYGRQLEAALAVRG